MHVLFKHVNGVIAIVPVMGKAIGMKEDATSPTVTLSIYVSSGVPPCLLSETPWAAKGVRNIG